MRCIANYDGARVDIYLDSGDTARNKASWLSYELKEVSIEEGGDWPRMAKFHAEWSDAICNAVLPYLQSEDKPGQRLSEVAGILREWTVSRPEVKANLAKCIRILTRFTTVAVGRIEFDLQRPQFAVGFKPDNYRHIALFPFFHLLTLPNSPRGVPCDRPWD